ncbi:MAG: hypothetical protein ACR2PO_11080 [Methyloligellaceae bacterium]
MKRFFTAAVLASAFALTGPASAEDKYGYTHDYVKEVRYGNGFVLVHLVKFKTKGEYGCKDPYYKLFHEHFGGNYEQVVSMVTQAAMYGAKIGFLVTGCEGEEKDGPSIVKEVKVDFGGYDQSGDRRGSYR